MHLGMSVDEFLDTTPRYFDQLCKQYARKRRTDEGMLAQLTAIVLNSSFRAPEQQVQSRQFHLTSDVDARPEKVKRRNKAAIADETRAVFIALMSGQE